MKGKLLEWVQALRSSTVPGMSGKFVQIKDNYCDPSNQYRVCALGILPFIGVRGSSWLEWSMQIKVPVLVLLEVYEMNNAGYSFNTIASHLEGWWFGAHGDEQLYGENE